LIPKRGDDEWFFSKLVMRAYTDETVLRIVFENGIYAP
jgi:hypothetical protein